VESTSFLVTESANIARSSWIRGASYYSCDNLIGFLILKTDKQEYIYKGVPVEVWNDFKEASSMGSYYNKKIKGQYILHLNAE